jgi:hypothetical protein
VIDVKNSFLSGLDLDTSLFLLKKDAYIDALNITRDAITGGQDMAITNVVGNRLVSYTLPAGDNTCIGSYANTIRNTVIYFLYNSNDLHSILQYNDTSRTITKIFENLTDSGGEDILGFTLTGKITSINIYPRDEGDLLYFLDSQGRPTGLNIARFIAGEYTPVTRAVINVIKAPPLSPPSAIYGNDTTVTSNNLKNKEFRFKTLFVYDDFEESVCSPISLMPLPVNILNQAYTNILTNNNVIYLSLNSGKKNVKSIKLLMSYAEKSNEWNDFVVVDEINKADVVLAVDLTQRTQGTTQLAYAIFSGVVTEGTVVTVKIRRISDGVVLTAGTYTTVPGDTIVDIVSTLQTALIGSGYMIAVSNAGNGLYFNFNNTLYDTPQVDIVNAITTTDDISFPYSFYNDSTYPVYDVRRSIQLFDYVPDLANAQDMPNGNVLAYGGITEGYNRDLVTNVVNVVSTYPVTNGVSGNLNGVVAILLDNSLTQTFSITFSGIPVPGTVINCNIRVVGTGTILLAATYTTIVGDTSTSVAAAIANSFNTIGEVFDAQSSGDTVVVFANAILSPKRVFESLNILPPSTVVASNSLATWKWSTSRSIGIAYFDANGKTIGIQYSQKITFPAYAESGGDILLPYINTKIYHLPPIEAYSFDFYFTKEPTQYLFWETSDVNTAEANYIYFNVTGLSVNAIKNPTTSQVLSYSFQDGDRMRLIKNTATNFVFTDNYDSPIEGLLVDPSINGTTQIGQFIKIKNVAPFNAITYPNKYYIIEIYRPGQSAANAKNQVFYECGRQYNVLNPGTANRVHSGEVTDQIIISNTPAEFNFYNGDSYFRSRVIYLSDTLLSSGVGQFNVQDRNFVDFYLSAVSSLEGRSNAIDINAKLAYFGAVIRHGQQYEPNTNINGLNRFYPESLIEASYTYGDIRRLKVRDKLMKIFQTNKVGYSPLFSQIHREAGGTLIAQTDKLLNPIQYYIGDWGIGDAPASLASFNFADYFADPVRGAIVRSSNDGLTPLSVVYKINSWATDEIPKRTGNYTMYGSYYQKSNNFILALEATADSPAYTISFDEETNAFESFLSYHPENMCALGTQFISWKDGELYTHDNSQYNFFHGVQYDSTITLVFNVQGLEKKTWESITEVANTIFDCPVIYTNSESFAGQRQETNLSESNFKVYEGNPSAAILRDINSRKGRINGDTMKGNYIAIKFRKQNASNLIYLSIVSVKYIDSPLTSK